MLLQRALEPFELPAIPLRFLRILARGDVGGSLSTNL